MLHAVELPAQNDHSPNVFVMKLLQAATHQMQDLLREVAPLAAGVALQEVVQVALRRTALWEEMAQQPPDLVVLGESGRPGSTPDWLIHKAPCPVLVVRHPLGPDPVRVVVFPTNFSVLASRAGSVLRQLQAFFPAAMLYVLHVGAVGDNSETLRHQLAILTQQQGLTGSELAVITAPSLRVGIAQFTQQVRSDMLVLRVGSAGLN